MLFYVKVNHPIIKLGMAQWKVKRTSIANTPSSESTSLEGINIRKSGIDKEESNCNDGPELNIAETDKIFDSIKVSSSLSRRLTDKRKNEIMDRSGCHSICHIIDYRSFDLSNQMQKDMINYLSKTYFNFPTHLPMIVCYGDRHSNAIAKAEISKTCKDIESANASRKHAKKQAETKRNVQEYKAQFVEDETEQRGEYHEMDGQVFYALPFRPINIKHKRFTERYHCKLHRYSHVNQIKKKTHLKYLRFRYGDRIQRLFPIFLVYRKVTKQHNAIMKDAIEFVKTFKLQVGPKKWKRTDDTPNDHGYREVNGSVYYALPLARLGCQKLTGHQRQRMFNKLKNIGEQYDCKNWLYFDMTKIRNQSHLRFLKLEFEDDIAKHLPICLTCAWTKNAKNMKPAITAIKNGFKAL
eukprot:155130_1